MNQMMSMQSNLTTDRRVVVCSGIVLVIFLWYVALHAGISQLIFIVIGFGLGISLYHAGFGFTGAWRRFLLYRQGDGVRAQMIMLSLAVLLFFPTLAAGTVFDRPVHGFVFPIGISVAIGAFMFGIGMQLGGGCASGTLTAVGTGNFRMFVTLLFFIIGSVVATFHMPWWLSLPQVPGYGLISQWGLIPALSVNILLFITIIVISLILEKSIPDKVLDENSHPHTQKSVIWRLVSGPWPLIWGSIALALFNYATLLTAGRPWSITSGLALWGAKSAESIGIDVVSWPAWSRAILDTSLAQDITSVMNISIILGVTMAAGLAGCFRLIGCASWRSLGAAIIGGIMLGYGARLAFGCNIGAFFSGIASGSLHGWLWFFCALTGNLIGIRLRPWFSLSS